MRRFVTVVVLLALAFGSGAPALLGAAGALGAIDDCDEANEADDAPGESDCCTPGDGCVCCLHLLQALHVGPDPTPRPGGADSLAPASVIADLALLPDDVLHVPRSRPHV